MTPSIYAVVLASAAVHAAWNLLIKRASDKFLMTVSMTTSASLLAVMLLPFFPTPDFESWIFIALSGGFSVLYFLMVAATYRVADMSLAYPVMRGSAPLIVGLAGVPLFDEHLPAMSWIGISIISAGIFSMGLARHEHGAKGLMMAVSTAFMIAVCTLIDAEGARRSGSAVAYTLWIFALTGITFGAWAMIAKREQLPPFLKRNWHLSLVAGAGALCSYGAALWTMTMAPVALVAALRETTVLFGAGFAWLVLNEKIGRPRLLAILIIAGGAIIMRLSLWDIPSPEA